MTPIVLHLFGWSPLPSTSFRSVKLDPEPDRPYDPHERRKPPCTDVSSPRLGLPSAPSSCRDTRVPVLPQLVIAFHLLRRHLHGTLLPSYRHSSSPNTRREFLALLLEHCQSRKLDSRPSSLPRPFSPSINPNFLPASRRSSSAAPPLTLILR